MVELEKTDGPETAIMEPVTLDSVVPEPDNFDTLITPTQEEVVSSKRSNSNPWILMLVGLLVGGLGGFYLRPLVFPEAATPVAPLAAVEDSGQMNKPDPHQAVMLAVTSGARHFQGESNAPITIIEFGDFNCGYCGRWTQETLPRIREKYVDTGKVKLAYIHYPILGADSMTAAQGTECAAQQQDGRFWDYHNLLYANQGIGFTAANLTKLAVDLGLDKSAFEQCLANFKDQPIIDEDVRLAQVMGVRGTPAFLVNGIPLAGAYPYEDFEHVIEGLLAGKF